MTKEEALALLQKIKQSSKEMIENIEEDQHDEKTTERIIEKQEAIL